MNLLILKFLILQKINLSNKNKIKIRFTDLHKEFQGIYESKLEELINSCGISIDEFYEGIRKVNFIKINSYFNFN